MNDSMLKNQKVPLTIWYQVKPDEMAHVPPNNRSGFRSLNLMTIGKNNNYHHSFMLAKGGRKILNIFDIFALLCLQCLGYVWSFLFKLKMYIGSPWLSGWLGPKKFPDNFGTTIPKIEILIIKELLL